MPWRSSRPAQPRPMPPWLALIIISGFVAVAEFLVMLLFSWALPRDVSPLIEAVLDALLLTVLVTPVLWWVMVRPLQQAAELRGRFLADLFATIEDERRRVASELHDGVGQSLTMLVSGLRSLTGVIDQSEIQRRQQDLRELAQRALTDTKHLALGLRPSLLDDLGLVAAIERLAAEVREHHEIDVSLEIAGQFGQRLSGPVETALFRIFQEAISNVVQHSQAQHVLARLCREPQSVVLEVRDDGLGIDLQNLSLSAQLSGHLGLIGMSERAGLLGGEMQFQSGPGQGTRIVVTIPERNAVHE